ncbi:MAG: DUF6443 domain-containing protein, partial [Ignavibacteriales bacterium]
MKRTIFLTTAFLLSLISNVFCQTNTENYIFSYDVLLERKYIEDLQHTTSDSVAFKTIEYFDGLGRSSQIIKKGYSYTNKDVIKPIKYDGLGIDINNYLPYLDKYSTGQFRSSYLSDLTTFYSDNYEDHDAYAPILLEKSPLLRVLKEATPGASWQLSEHPITYSYLTNTPDLKIKMWEVQNDDYCELKGFYANNDLFVTKKVDADSSITYKFKDKLGQIVMERIELTSSEFLDTYYIYDNHSLLRFVISPEGSYKMNEGFSVKDKLAREFVYFYKYDHRKRLVEKKVPGKEIEYFVYDKADKVVLYQDGNMRQYNNGKSKFGWKFTKYDALGRVIITGLTYQFPEESRDEIQLKALANDQIYELLYYDDLAYPALNYNYYTNQTFPILISDDIINTVDYFDSYYFTSSKTYLPIINDANMSYNQADASFTMSDLNVENVSGLKTVSFIRFNQSFYPSVYYYDIRKRLIQERSKNHLDGIDITSNEYFTKLVNSVVRTDHKHSTVINKISYSQTEKYHFIFDDELRLIQRTYVIGSLSENKISFNYDPLGNQVIEKKISEGTKLLQTLNYNFNIKGWLTKINNIENFASSGDFFAMDIYYDKKIENFNTSLYNGEISFIKWQTVPPTGNTNSEFLGSKGYKFSYDKSKRLNNAEYYDDNQGKFGLTSVYNEHLSYDQNGNITSMIRNGKNYLNLNDVIDRLNYSYEGNQLLAIDDKVTFNNGYDFTDNGHYYYPGDSAEYHYDNNGNMISDLNKEIISIQYDNNNLPISIIFKNNCRIDYYYDALGTLKLQTVTKEGILMETTDFAGNFVYINGKPAWNNFDEGRVVYTLSGPCFIENYLKDHLGNVRVAYSSATDGTVLSVKQVNTYYPFGMSINSLTSTKPDKVTKNEYLYNGKMFQDELG